MRGEADKGCLVIHGLTGAPEVMKSVTDALINDGFEVNAPLLPGHGGKPEDLDCVRWTEWRNAVIDAYFDLRRTVRKISCVGLSLGGLLALDLASELRFGVRATAVMGTPFFLGNYLEYFLYPMVRYTPLRWFYRFSRKDWGKSVADAGGREFYIRHSYDKISIHAVMELFKLKRALLAKLDRITSPVFLMYGRGDEIAPLRNIEIIKKRVSTSMLDIAVFDRSQHVLTLDYDRARAAGMIVSFLDRFL